jgi:DNA repair exonuclease SbcCD ATPase subunit
MSSHDAVPDDVIPPLQRLEMARHDLTERAELNQRLRSLNTALERARREHQRLRDELTREEYDVDRLEGVSAARVWSSLRGSRGQDLDRERAEATAAAHAVDRQASVVEQAREEVERIAARARQLDDADAEYVAALEAVAGSGGTVDDAHVAHAVDELARLRELREVDQARVAGRSARQGLAAALTTLDSADAWSGWDTFGGGGMLTSAFKHERLDEARQRLHLAGEALDRFTRELDDLRMPGVALPEFSGLTRGLDIFWDNVFTDLLVRDEIKRCKRSVEAAIARVDDTVASLDIRREQLMAT